MNTRKNRDNPRERSHIWYAWSWHSSRANPVAVSLKPREPGGQS